jgi:hypothetical protein
MVSNIFRSKLHYLTLKSVISLNNWVTEIIARNGVRDLDSETTERRAHKRSTSTEA